MEPDHRETLTRMRFRVGPEDAGTRLDRFLVRSVPGASRRDVSAWIDAGRVRCGGRFGRKGERLCTESWVDVTLPPEHGPKRPEPESGLRIEVLWEDPWIVALSKPAGVPCHPLRPGETGTVANFLAARYPETESVGYSEREPGLVHRLDRDTSGVLLAARTGEGFERLRRQFVKRQVIKVYLALVLGRPNPEGSVCLPVGTRARRGRRVRVVAAPGSGGRMRSLYPAETSYRLVRAGEPVSLVRIVMRTGARHQIRAHMEHLGHPVAGDRLYGRGNAGEAPGIEPAPPRHLLHASEIRFIHPDESRRPMRIHCPLPADFRAWLRAYGLSRSRESSG